MIHPATELRYISPDVGYGVFATEPIPKGTIIWVLDEFDRVLTPGAVEALPEVLRTTVEKYAYVTADGMFVFCWDFGRYMNHSCSPVSRGVGETFEVAVRDVAAGEELTCEYGTLNLIRPLDCTCGASNCRGTVQADDAARLHELWDDEARSAFALAAGLPQPLLPYAKVTDADRPLLDALLKGTAATVPSARDYLHVR